MARPRLYQKKLYQKNQAMCKSFIGLILDNLYPKIDTLDTDFELETDIKHQMQQMFKDHTKGQNMIRRLQKIMPANTDVKKDKLNQVTTETAKYFLTHIKPAPFTTIFKKKLIGMFTKQKVDIQVIDDSIVAIPTRRTLSLAPLAVGVLTLGLPFFIKALVSTINIVRKPILQRPCTISIGNKDGLFQVMKDSFYIKFYNDHPNKVIKPKSEIERIDNSTIPPSPSPRKRVEDFLQLIAAQKLIAAQEQKEEKEFSR